MRSITLWMAAVTTVAVVLSAGAVRHALAGEPATPSSAAKATGGMAGKETDGSEAAPPAAEGQPSPSAEATDIQERGLLPGLVAPRAPSGTLQSIQSIAPTPSLNAIVKAILVTSKSVSVNLRIPPNLPVTVPVEVSVAYISPAQAQRRTKTYNPATGLAILYREAEGDGKPRSMRMDITMRELVPNGQSFSISKQLTITPLYRTSISPLRFNMFTQCDTVGKSDITFRWRWPDGQLHERKFDLGFGETKTVNLFSWGRREFSTEANLKEPVVNFIERDLNEYVRPFGYSGIALVPGPTKEFSFVLNEQAMGPPASPIGSTGCKAQISYRIDRNLMTFDQPDNSTGTNLPKAIVPPGGLPGTLQQTPTTPGGMRAPTTGTILRRGVEGEQPTSSEKGGK